MAKKTYDTSNKSKSFNGKPTVTVFKKANKDLEDITDSVIIETAIHFRDFVSWTEFEMILTMRMQQLYNDYPLLHKNLWSYEDMIQKLKGVWSYDEPHFSDWWIDQIVEKLACNVYNVVWSNVVKELQDDTKRDKVAYKQAENAYANVKEFFK